MRKTIALSLAATLGSTVLLFACGENDPEPPTGAAGSDAGADSDGGTADYPPGPYGVESGSVIKNLSWQGWREPVAAGFDEGSLETITLGDYYDPDGSKGYKAIVINAAARWCGICKLEQKDIRENHEEWGPKGVVILEALFEDVSGDPAQPSDLVAWGQTYQIDWVLVLDPASHLSAYFDTSSAPMNMVVNPRTMEIRDIITGLPDESWWSGHLEALTAK